MNQYEIVLCEGVTARAEQVVGLVSGKENRRVTVQIISNVPNQNRIIKDYYVWIDPEYSQKKNTVVLDDQVAKSIALDIVKQKFEENGRETPIEDGIYLSGEEVVIVDPKTFIHPVEVKNHE